MIFLWRFLLVLVLTALTQIGGLAYLVSLGLARLAGWRKGVATFSVFLVVYAGATVLTQSVAPVFGRVPLSCGQTDMPLAVRSPLFCALNRNYVTPAMKTAAIALARHMEATYPGTVTLALDANFPFLSGFPLLPHLSHNDGRKLDVAFYYRTSGGEPLNGVTRSPLGYFAFEQPQPGDVLPCAGRHDLLSFRWDLDVLQPMFKRLPLDEARTAAAVSWLSTRGQDLGVEKIFIEPHLARTLGVENEIVRFQGCRAARHDDHIHFQVRPHISGET
ncbi:hypothetical protein [Rhizobium sp. PP-CC-3G-465]|uniref:hypothetical protein n=1 Tax=Rhizobium sp. PP-CC-3G-465 TaxID=2135648 RepID=UPI00104ED8F5|nr:hypothetical protein C8J33_1012270 [Rhizobium sp. PP-CC-3G-465]